MHTRSSMRLGRFVMLVVFVAILAAVSQQAVAQVFTTPRNSTPQLQNSSVNDWTIEIEQVVRQDVEPKLAKQLAAEYKSRKRLR